MADREIYLFDTKAEAIAAANDFKGCTKVIYKDASAGGWVVAVAPLENEPAAQAAPGSQPKPKNRTENENPAPESFDDGGISSKKGGKGEKSKRVDK